MGDGNADNGGGNALAQAVESVATQRRGPWWGVRADRPRHVLALSRSKLFEVVCLGDQGDGVELAVGLSRRATWTDAGDRVTRWQRLLPLRAERRVGELLAGMSKNDGGRPFNNQLRSATSLAPTLTDLGLTKSDSSRWQALASLPEA